MTSVMMIDDCCHQKLEVSSEQWAICGNQWAVCSGQYAVDSMQ